jgi:hypothetical protein
MLITTPIKKHKVELKDFITGREFEEIQKPITDVKIQIEAGGKGVGEINAGEVQRKSTEKAIEIIVVSIDGETKDVLNKVYDMPSKDYSFVLAEVDKVGKGVNFTKPE